jgi:hypothetical protein
MPQDARFGAPAGRPAAERVDDYGFFAPAPTPAAGAGGQAAPPAPFGTPPPFGAPLPPEPPDAPARSGLPVWATALIAAGGLLAVGIAASVALSAFLGGRQHSQLADTSVALPASVIGLPRATDPATQAQADQLAADIPREFTLRQAAGYVADSSTLLVAAAKAPHVLTLPEQESLTRSFWARQAASVPEGSSLAAPSTPAGAGATGTLTCADELTSDGTATVCVDAQATALVVFVLASSSDSGPDATAPTQVPPAVVHGG